MFLLLFAEVLWHLAPASHLKVIKIDEVLRRVVVVVVWAATVSATALPLLAGPFFAQHFALYFALFFFSATPAQQPSVYWKINNNRQRQALVRCPIRAVNESCARH